MMKKLIKILSICLMAILAAKAGRITFNGHTETWYDLPMTKVVQQAQQVGIPCEYWVRDDGVKMFGPWVIVAAHSSKIRYSRIQTSLGEGIILDTHEMPETELYDIATDWKE